MKYRTIAVLSVAVAVLLCSFPAVTSAQDSSEAARALYASSATVPTNIHGVYTFRTPPEGFDALAASDEELAIYGYPPRPNAQTDPDSNAKWTRAMKAWKIHWNGQLRAMGHSNGPMKPAPGTSTEASGISGTPSSGNSFNWSGVVNTNSLTKWNSKSSIYYATSEFTVPVAQQPFGACDGGYDIEVSWAGIDGFKDGDVLQGGSESAAFCSGGSTTPFYCGWVEWFPSYSVICEFGVNPGDVIFAEPFSPGGGTTEGFVFVVDETLGVGSTYGLTYVSGPGLVGNSGEYIVERPCCRSGNDYPLANYVGSFWYSNEAVDFNHYHAGTASQYFAGSQVPTTFLLTMVADDGTTHISYPIAGSAGNEGKFGLTFFDENCAFSGGCTP